jgi:hypothetical protein
MSWISGFLNLSIDSDVQPTWRTTDADVKYQHQFQMPSNVMLTLAKVRNSFETPNLSVEKV